jgi:hypothetical protein
MLEAELLSTLDEAGLRARWAGHPKSREIEKWRVKLRADERSLRSIEGGSGPYDDQTIRQAAGGSKNFLNCLRLCQVAHDHAGAGAVVELGTNVGISSAYLALGASEASSHAVVLTGDVSEARLKVAREMHEAVGLKNLRYYGGYFEETVDPMLEDAGRVGLCFIDGDHTYDGTWRYFRQILPLMAEGSLIVFDDIDWSDGMRQFWAEMSSDSGGRRLCVALEGVGYVSAD